MCLTLAHIHRVWRLPDWLGTPEGAQRSPPLIGVSACTPQLLCVVRYSHTLRGALLAHAYGLFRVTLQLRAIGNYETVTLCFVFSLFGNNFYAGLTLRARATRGLRRPTSGYRPYVGRLYGPRR